MTEPLAGLVRHQYLLFTHYQTDMALQQIVDPITQLKFRPQALKGSRYRGQSPEPTLKKRNVPHSLSHFRALPPCVPLLERVSPEAHFFRTHKLTHARLSKT